MLGKNFAFMFTSPQECHSSASYLFALQIQDANQNCLVSGIWADDSDDEELSARPSFKTFDKVPKNYTAPVSFVAGGVQQAGKPKEEEKKDDDDSDDENASKSREFPNSSR